MHDIWNPWHGCHKCSEGCAHCYMYYLDRAHDRFDSAEVTKTSGFGYPLARDRRGAYKVKSGETIRVCMTSDFFVEEADAWRDEAWQIMRERSDVIFYILTKRPERAAGRIPRFSGYSYENISFNVTCENGRRAEERIPVLLDLPFAHKGVMTAPLIGEVSLERYLAGGQIEQVICGGENYDGARPCRYEWVKRLSDECRAADVTFAFIETGNVYVKDGRTRHIRDKRQQARLAFREGLSYRGKRPTFALVDRFGLPIPQNELYVPHYREACEECGSRLICNGCSDCGKCVP